MTFQPFYRYLRPVSFDGNRFSPIAKSAGGVSFLVTNYSQQNDHFEVTLAVAVCPMSQLFDRRVAKKILDTRAQEGHTIKITTLGLDAESLGKGLVFTSDMNRLQVNDTDIFQQYLKMALHEYADAVEYILKSQRSAEFLMKTSSETLSALGIGDFYKGN